MAPRLEDLKELIADVVALDDPVERFRKLGDLANGEFSARIRAERVRIVREIRAREPRPTWAEIGALLGVSVERARQLSEDTTTKETVQ